MLEMKQCERTIEIDPTVSYDLYGVHATYRLNRKARSLNKKLSTS